MIISISLLSQSLNKQQQQELADIIKDNQRKEEIFKLWKLSEKALNYTYETFSQRNGTLCSEAADRRGPHQKIIALSIYGTTSKFSNNPLFSWEKSILPFLEPLVHEVKLLLPAWIIRIYIDFAGSTKSQRDVLYSYSNIDICDISNIPVFGSSLFTYLPGKMWRFLPVFDPYVDYVLSRDLDSPMMHRETEALDIWLSDAEKNNFFYIARDHFQHNSPILGGLWGAATVRARPKLFNIFRPMLISSIGSQYNGEGDQLFLKDFIWDKIKIYSLIFDSFYCQKFGGRPFPTKRLQGNYHLGCRRACCTNVLVNSSCEYVPPCPKECRPRDHPEWEFC